MKNSEVEKQKEIIKQNMKIRSAYLGRSISDLCRSKNVNPKVVFSSLHNGNPTLFILMSIASMLSIPLKDLFDPEFDPKSHPIIEENTVGF